ncbi:MAG: ATP-binding cassette domain-containing protein [Elusimicrobia bacterium]|nr:ATP-binding cassette domain-containing protein [Elusimicrobiota bacterium]
MNPIVEIVQLSYSYKLNSKSFREALKEVTLSVQTPEIFGFLGPNGGGKTTLFRILSTYTQPSSGKATLFGFDIQKNSADIREKIGVLFQSPSLDKMLTVQENLVHHGHLYGLSGTRLQKRISELLNHFGLSQRSGEKVETLSGGLQRRVEIAKGLIHSPQLILMDEPSNGLDPGARKDLWDYLKALKSEGITILLTTHLMEEAEKCDRLGILNEGRLVAIGSPSAIKEEIGGDVLTIKTKEPKILSEKIQEKFQIKSSLLEDSLRIERTQGDNLVPQLVQSFGEEITSITLGKPTLEDVFIHKTGHRFGKKGKDE